MQEMDMVTATGQRYFRHPQEAECATSGCVPAEPRPDWDEYFLGIAKAVAARADCSRRQHGAVIVRDHRIVSTGYNGSPPGGKSCLAGECPHAGGASETGNYSACIALHAEQNAIAYATIAGDTIYITGKPCDMCDKLIKAAGIGRVVF